MGFRFPHAIQPKAARRTPDRVAIAIIGRNLAWHSEGLLTDAEALRRIRLAYAETLR